MFAHFNKSLSISHFPDKISWNERQLKTIAKNYMSSIKKKKTNTKLWTTWMWLHTVQAFNPNGSLLWSKACLLIKSIKSGK